MLTQALDFAEEVKTLEAVLLSSGQYAEAETVLAQRLARKLCPDCREEWRPKPEVLIDAGFDAE